MLALRYQGHVGDKKQRRPPTVTEWAVDDDFHSRLEELFKSGRFKKNAELERFLIRELAYPIGPSTISNLRRRIHPSSRFVGPICDVFGWPYPPVTTVDPESSLVVSQLLEVIAGGGATKGEVETFIKTALDQRRRYRKLLQDALGPDKG